MNSPRVERYESWTRLLAQLFSAVKPPWFANSESTVYRGMADSGWSLLTSVERFASSHGLDDAHRLAGDIHAAYRENCVVLGLDAQAMSDADLMLYGQHNGLPTRVLDWTRSPFIAMFFAYYDRLLSKKGAIGPDSMVCVWCLDTSGGVFDPGGSATGVRPLELLSPAPTHTNERMYRQMGVMTRNNAGQPLAKLLEGMGMLDRLTQVQVPAADVVEALADLRRMGIDELRMYPDLQGAALEAQVRVLVERVAAKGDR